jgi:hypothetical protein
MKADLKRELACYSARAGVFDVVSVPSMQFLMIDGQGDPNTSSAYADAVATLFPAGYALKSLSRDELGRDYTVMPLEGLWWADDMATFTASRDKASWRWTAMMMVPDWISGEHVETARREVGRKAAAPALEQLRFERLAEGLAVQTLHIGPYDAEGPTLARMHEEFIPGHSLRPTGKHHEIYLGDPRRAAPEKLRTILRQPVVRAAAGREPVPSELL